MNRQGATNAFLYRTPLPLREGAGGWVISIPYQLLSYKIPNREPVCMLSGSTQMAAIFPSTIR